MDKIWEVNTFKEFLFENMNLEDLYFYLYVRNLIFAGPVTQMEKSFFEVILYVNSNWVGYILEKIFKAFDDY